MKTVWQIFKGNFPNNYMCKEHLKNVHCLALFPHLQHGESALLLASWKGHEAVVGLLIEAHALINLKDNVRR